MPSPIRTFFEIIWLYCKGFRPVEFVREDDRISLHPSGWRVNGSGRLKRAKDAVSYLESAEPEQWRQIYCGMTPFLVSDKGNVKHIDGNPVKMTLANGRYQIMYKPEDSRGRGRDGRTHKKRVYRSMLVAMAWLDFRKGDTDHEIHHINGYRTDDRVANLMIVDHEEHLRIHNLGPCALSGLPDERIVDAPAGCEAEGEEPETYAGAHVALRPETKNQDAEPRKKKRRRGKRGGKGRSGAAQQQQTEQPGREIEDERPQADARPEAKTHANATTRPPDAIRPTTRQRPNPPMSPPMPTLPWKKRRLKPASVADAASAKRVTARRQVKMHPNPKRTAKAAPRKSAKLHPKKARRPTMRPRTTPTGKKPPNAAARAKTTATKRNPNAPSIGRRPERVSMKAWTSS